jgi:hypothetical protein
MALTIALVRERAQTSLSDEALGSLLADTYLSLARVLGPAGPLTELLTADAGDLLLLSRPADEITTVVELEEELDPADYALQTTHLLVRLSTGPNPSSRWRGRPAVTYTVLNDEAERDRLALALIKLELDHHPGLVSRRLGEYSEAYGQGAGNYSQERDDIFASYHGTGGFI